MAWDMQLFLLTVGSFLRTVELFYLQLSLGVVLLTVVKVDLRSTLRDCKQTSSTVSKKAPTVSKKASPQGPKSLVTPMGGGHEQHRKPSRSGHAHGGSKPPCAIQASKRWTAYPTGEMRSCTTLAIFFARTAWS